MIEQLKDFIRQGKESIKYKNKMAKIALGFWKLKKDIKNMSEIEVKNKGVDLLSDFLKKIVDMSPLELEQEAAQKGKGLKILIPKQMITRLPILLAQLKAGNNSQKLRNEIRQLLYHLYRSKNLSKTICNSLINNI